MQATNKLLEKFELFRVSNHQNWTTSALDPVLKDLLVVRSSSRQEAKKTRSVCSSKTAGRASILQSMAKR